MNPVVLHVVRPFATEAEFLENEAWTIEARGMLLVDQRGLDPETAVVFDVALANGTKIIRAEGRAVEYVAGTTERPGGLRIRFRRFGAQTKAFIDRAVARAPEPSRARSSPPPPKFSTTPAAGAPSETAAPAAVEGKRRGLDDGLPQASSGPHTSLSRREEPSGVHARPIAPVVTPVNRDELLARLRTRAREKSDPPSANAQRS